jgi:flavodoxin
MRHLKGELHNELKKKKTLIAYFSRPGNNYVNGKIVNLPVGNTEVLAKMIQGITNSDIFQINPVNPYPLDYNETTKLAQKELREKARPKLSNYVKNMDSYDVVFAWLSELVGHDTHAHRKFLIRIRFLREKNCSILYQ